MTRTLCIALSLTLFVVGLLVESWFTVHEPTRTRPNPDEVPEDVMTQGQDGALTLYLGDKLTLLDTLSPEQRADHLAEAAVWGALDFWKPSLESRAEGFSEPPPRSPGPEESLESTRGAGRRVLLPGGIVWLFFSERDPAPKATLARLVDQVRMEFGAVPDSFEVFRYRTDLPRGLIRVERLARHPSSTFFKSESGYVQATIESASDLGRFLGAVDDLTYVRIATNDSLTVGGRRFEEARTAQISVRDIAALYRIRRIQSARADRHDREDSTDETPEGYASGCLDLSLASLPGPTTRRLARAESLANGWSTLPPSVNLTAPGEFPGPDQAPHHLGWNDSLRLTDTKLWFGPDPKGFAGLPDASGGLVFEHRPTRLYAAHEAGSGAHGTPNRQALDRVMNWWRHSYDHVATVEPGLHLQNQVAKWWIVTGWLVDQPYLTDLAGIGVGDDPTSESWNAESEDHGTTLGPIFGGLGCTGDLPAGDWRPTELTRVAVARGLPPLIPRQIGSLSTRRTPPPIVHAGIPRRSKVRRGANRGRSSGRDGRRRAEDRPSRRDQRRARWADQQIRLHQYLADRAQMDGDRLLLDRIAMVLEDGVDPQELEIFQIPLSRSQFLVELDQDHLALVDWGAGTGRNSRVGRILRTGRFERSELSDIGHHLTAQEVDSACRAIESAIVDPDFARSWVDRSPWQRIRWASGPSRPGRVRRVFGRQGPPRSARRIEIELEDSQLDEIEAYLDDAVLYLRRPRAGSARSIGRFNDLLTDTDLLFRDLQRLQDSAQPVLKISSSSPRARGVRAASKAVEGNFQETLQEFRQASTQGDLRTAVDSYLDHVRSHLEGGSRSAEAYRLLRGTSVADRADVQVAGALSALRRRRPQAAKEIIEQVIGHGGREGIPPPGTFARLGSAASDDFLRLKLGGLENFDPRLGSGLRLETLGSRLHTRLPKEALPRRSVLSRDQQIELLRRLQRRPPVQIYVQDSALLNQLDWDGAPGPTLSQVLQNAQIRVEILDGRGLADFRPTQLGDPRGLLLARQIRPAKLRGHSSDVVLSTDLIVISSAALTSTNDSGAAEAAGTPTAVPQDAEWTH